MRRHYLADTQAANRSISSLSQRLRSDRARTDGRAIHRHHCDGETCSRAIVEAMVVAAGAARSRCARCNRPVRRTPTTACVAKRSRSRRPSDHRLVAKAIASSMTPWLTKAIGARDARFPPRTGAGSSRDMSCLSTEAGSSDISRSLPPRPASWAASHAPARMRGITVQRPRPAQTERLGVAETQLAVVRPGWVAQERLGRGLRHRR
jgi:hypothetical protein